MALVVPEATEHRVLRVRQVHLFPPLQLARLELMAPWVLQPLQRDQQQSRAPMVLMEQPEPTVSQELPVLQVATRLPRRAKARQVWMVLRLLQPLRLLRLPQMRPKARLGLMASMRWGLRLLARMVLMVQMV